MKGLVAGTVAITALVAAAPARAQSLEDLCGSMEGVCRELGDGERAAYAESLQELLAALPLPNEQRFQRTELRSLGHFGPIPDVGWDRWHSEPPSSLVYPKAVTYRSGGSFPQALGVVDSFARGNSSGKATPSFKKLAKLQPGEPPWDLRIEAIALPVGFFPKQEKGSKVLKKEKDHFAYETMIDGELEHVTLLGPRSANAADAEPTWAAPPAKLDGIGGLMVRITGPAADVRSLAKEIPVKRLKKLITEAPPEASAAAAEGGSESGTVKIQEVKQKKRR